MTDFIIFLLKRGDISFSDLIVASVKQANKNRKVKKANNELQETNHVEVFCHVSCDKEDQCEFIKICRESGVFSNALENKIYKQSDYKEKPLIKYLIETGAINNNQFLSAIDDYTTDLLIAKEKLSGAI